MSLADFPFRDEYDHERYADAVARLHSPVLYGYTMLEGDPAYAPYDDDQFAYFSDLLAYLNELPAEHYYHDDNVEKRRAVNAWLSLYAQFVFASQWR
jgi:hypothetical protein